MEASGGGGWSCQPGCEVCWYSGDCTSARNLPFNWASLALGLTLNWSISSLPSSLTILANIKMFSSLAVRCFVSSKLSRDTTSSYSPLDRAMAPLSRGLPRHCGDNSVSAIDIPPVSRLPAVCHPAIVTSASLPLPLHQPATHWATTGPPLQLVRNRNKSRIVFTICMLSIIASRTHQKPADSAPAARKTCDMA